MAKARRAKPGDYLKIPLGEGDYGYGKLVSHGEVSVLDAKSAEDILTVEELATRAILFRVPVMEYAFNSDSHWKVIGSGVLTASETEASKFFKRDPINGKLSIYHEGENYPDGYVEIPATYEECRGLECAAVWEPEHVESRIRDHFAGRENAWVKQLSLD